ncbi:MAG: hypothetical protein IJ928_08370, partial [Prevotella sp.]|nr:hypothetical protein [Prevotella sp.]
SLFFADTPRIGAKADAKVRQISIIPKKIREKFIKNAKFSVFMTKVKTEKSQTPYYIYAGAHAKGNGGAASRTGRGVLKALPWPARPDW